MRKPSPQRAPNLVEAVAARKLPAVYLGNEFVEAGALISFGPDKADSYRRAAGFVAKILRGAKPGDLPVEQPIHFELIVNLRTTKALGLTIPPVLLARADAGHRIANRGLWSE